MLRVCVLAMGFIGVAATAAELVIHQPGSQNTPSKDRVAVEHLSAMMAEGKHAAALEALQSAVLGQNSPEVRFGIATVAPAIAQGFLQANDPRATAAFEQLVIWADCGLLAYAGKTPFAEEMRALGQHKAPRTRARECEEPINFNAFQ